MDAKTLPADHAAPMPETPAEAKTTPLAGPASPTIVGALEPASLPTVPGFLIEAELGHGGMGVVYRAKQLGLDRTVALKMILKADFASAEQKLRFRIEAENAARVQHPNIVQVHEIGEHLGQPYFALEFVNGGNLAELLQSRRLNPAEAAALVETLARAVHAAHLQGIVHRDLKPANVLLARPERESGEFTPKIADFGLAKRLDSPHDLTNSGDQLGTPAYMAPEQARGDTKHVGPGADQHALGVIFYQLLTHRLPFQAVTVPALLKKIAEDEPAPPRGRNAAVPIDLEVICLKALAKEPGRRYASAEALADDLKNWREHRPIAARPATRVERVAKWCRRYPAVAALIAVSVLAAVLASGLAWWAVGERDAKEANLKTARAETQRAESERRIAAAVNEFLQVDLLRQASVERQADALLASGRSARETKRDPRLSVVLARAAEALAPDRVGRRFPNQPLVQAELLVTLGVTLREMGEAQQAAPHLERARALLERAAGPTDPRTLAAAGNLALAYELADRHDEAIGLYRWVLRERREKIGALHTKTLLTQGSLGSALVSIGQKQEGLALLKATHEGLAATLGRLNGDALMAEMNYAVGLMDAGDVAGAIDSLEKSHQGLKALGGERHPALVDVLTNLGLARQRAGDLREALLLLEQAYRLAIDTSGESSAVADTTLISFTTGLMRANQAPRAKRLLEESWTRRTRGGGHASPLSASLLANLAIAHQETGDLPGAIDRLRQAHEMLAQEVGEFNSEALTVRANLAAALHRSGDLPSATQLLEEVREAEERLFGADHPKLVFTLGNLAVMYEDLKRPEQAAERFIQAARIVEKKGFRHEIAAIALNNCVGALEDAGRLQEAADWRRKLAAFVKKESGATSAAYARELAGLGFCLLRLKEWQGAEATLKEALKLRQAAEPSLWTTFNSRAQLGAALLALGRHSEAEPLLAEGFAGMKKRELMMPPAARLRLAEAAGSLAQLCDETGRPDEAERWRKEEWKRRHLPVKPPAR